MKQIFAIGGGGFCSHLPDLKMERYLLSLSKKPEPKILFLPQASAEDPYYVSKFFQTFCELGAKPSVLSLFGRVDADWQKHIFEQDIIYVGGGNTKSLVGLWRAWGVDKALKQAYEQGIILSGVSAGAICWFEQCISDSIWPIDVVEGLGFVQGSCCPHFDSEAERQAIYRTAVREKRIKPGYALDDRTAMHLIDGDIQFVKTETERRVRYLDTGNRENMIEVSLIP